MTPSEIAQRLEEIALKMDSALARYRAEYGQYDLGLIEYRMDKADKGSESRVLREAVSLLSKPPSDEEVEVAWHSFMEGEYGNDSRIRDERSSLRTALEAAWAIRRGAKAES
jgi:hypothetical protein